MAACQCHYLTFEVPNEGNGKERVGKDVCMSDIVVVVEGTLFGTSDKESPLQGFWSKNLGNKFMGMENQSLVLIVKGKQPFDRSSIYIFLDKDWHKLRGKLKGKLIIIVCPVLVILGKVVS